MSLTANGCESVASDPCRRRGPSPGGCATASSASTPQATIGNPPKIRIRPKSETMAESGSVICEILYSEPDLAPKLKGNNLVSTNNKI